MTTTQENPTDWRSAARADRAADREQDRADRAAREQARLDREQLQLNADLEQRRQEKARRKHLKERRRHHKDIAAEADRLLSALPFGSITEEEAFAAAWRVHKGAEPGMSAELYAKATDAKVAMGAAVELGEHVRPELIRAGLLAHRYNPLTGPVQPGGETAPLQRKAPEKPQVMTQIPPTAERSSKARPKPPVRRKGDTAPFHPRRPARQPVRPRSRAQPSSRPRTTQPRHPAVRAPDRLGPGARKTNHRAPQPERSPHAHRPARPRRPHRLRRPGRCDPASQAA